MELWQLYLLMTLDRVSGIIAGTLAGAGFLNIFWLAFWINALSVGANLDSASDADKQVWTTIMKTRFLPMALAVLLVLHILIPSTRDAMLIVGGYYATNIEGVKELPENVVDAANAFLKEYATDKQ